MGAKKTLNKLTVLRDQNYRRGKQNKTKTEPNLAWASGANLGL